MNDAQHSFRRILVSTSIVGGATVVTIAIGLVRNKLLALTLGPAGMGVVGLLTAIMATAAATGSMGLGFSGVREIATEGGNRGTARRALWLATVPLAALAATVVWFARGLIARLVADDSGLAFGIGLTAIGVALSILSVAQLAELQGYRRIGDLARVRIYGALLSLVLGVPAVLVLGNLGIAVAVIAVPLGPWLAALPYRPAAELDAGHPSRARIHAELGKLFSLGFVVMLTSSLSTASLVVIRMLIIRAQGLDAAGLYQAAYSISAMNVTLILGAMAADYFPRLSATEHDRAASAMLIDQQLRAALLLGAPLLMGMVALAPIALHLLYSAAFLPAGELLRWQLTGELLKLPGWALGFLLIARRDTLRFLFVESLFVVLYAGGTALLLPLFGLTGAGLAYLGGYLGYSLVLIALCRLHHGIALSRGNLGYLALVLVALCATTLLGRFAPLLAGVAGAGLAVAFAAYAARELDRAADLFNRLGEVLAKRFPVTAARREGKAPKDGS